MNKIKLFAQNHRQGLKTTAWVLGYVATFYVFAQVTAGMEAKAADHFIDDQGLSRILVYLANGETVSFTENKTSE